MSVYAVNYLCREVLRDHAFRAAMKADPAAALAWAGAAKQARIYLLSRLPGETAEQLYATPLEHAGQVQRRLGNAKSCLFLADAHKTLAVAADTQVE